MEPASKIILKLNSHAEVDSKTGLRITLIITPELVKMNGITHDNRWRN